MDGEVFEYEAADRSTAGLVSHMKAFNKKDWFDPREASVNIDDAPIYLRTLMECTDQPLLRGCRE